MENNSQLILSETDFNKLKRLLLVADPVTADLLEEELGRAKVVLDEELPGDIVSMNSQVLFKDILNKKESLITLVYPHEAKLEEQKISVLAPIGSALIGLRVGQSIHWPIREGQKRELKVISVQQNVLSR